VDLDPTSLFVNLMVSIVGLAIFTYGKKQKRVPQLVAGLLLMVYPYFISNVLVMTGVGVGIIGLLFAAVRYGM
jgi:hypothetical protein